MRRDVDQHITVCSGRAPCDHCGVVMAKGEKEEHSRHCPEVEIECRFSAYGCTATFKRKEEGVHMDYQLQRHLDLVRDSHHGLQETVGKVVRWKDRTSRKMKRMKERHRKDCDELMDRIHKLEMKMEEDSTESAGGDDGDEGDPRSPGVPRSDDDQPQEEEEVDWGELEYEYDHSDQSASSNSGQSV